MQLSTDNIRYIYTTINDWIKYSDTKAALILAFNGVMIGLMGSKLKELIMPRFGFSSCANGVFSTLVLLFFVDTMVSALLAAWAVYPRLSVGEVSSHIYFAHIAKRLENALSSERRASKVRRGKIYQEVSAKYKSELAQLPDEEFEKEISDQIFAVSVVCWQKYKKTNYSLRALITAIILGIAIVCISMFLDP